MSEPARICSACTHAALDSGGVWCKFFAESIYDEHTAEQCEMFEGQEPLVMAPRPILAAVPPDTRQDEFVRSVSFQVDLDYYGTEGHAERIEKNFVRQVGLAFGSRGKVKRL
jgi:hypothetical protein